MHRCNRAAVAVTLALVLLETAAQAVPAKDPDAVWLQERRLQLRQLNQQQQARLKEALRCLDRATSQAELERCERGYGPGWHMGPGMYHGMGGWSCPIW